LEIYQYIVAVIICFIFWFLIFKYFRKKKDILSKKDKFRGYWIFGPMFKYIQNRGFTLTKRELLGWAIVFLLMLLAPFLERLF